jgi:hypothetical protein
MIIMQTEDADKRREYIIKNNLAKVITYGKSSVSTIVQYHPKGIKGWSNKFHYFNSSMAETSI